MSAGSRIELEPGWLLSQQPYRETSALLEVLTASHGRVGLVARGQLGPKSRQRGVVALFRPLLLSWLARGDLGTLVAVEPAGPALELAGERLFHGWYLNELLLKALVRHDPLPSVHADYGRALAGLGGSAEAAETALRRFEKRLLDTLGYGLPLDDTLVAEDHYRYLSQQGFAPCVAEARGALAGTSLIALRDEADLDARGRDDCRRLLRAALEPLVPRASLRTPQLLREMRAFAAATRGTPP